MTHDELLDKIGHWNWVEPEPLLKALRAVVELHSPMIKSEDSISYHCPICPVHETPKKDGEWLSYWCKTLLTIEKELK